MINMNKKGFTLVELLATIVIIGLIGGLAVVAYSSLIHQSEDKVFETYMDTMHGEAILYLSNNPGEMPANGSNKNITLTQLNVDPINNPKKSTDLCLGSYVNVKRTVVNGVDSITYTVYLVCDDYSNHKVYEN